jgi:hypothetical protein
MQMRAKIKPLENEVRNIEKRIGELEAEQARENQLLALASGQGNLEGIQTLSKSCAAREKQLQILYDTFMELEEKLQIAKKQLD